MSANTEDKWLSQDWQWDSKIINLDKWYEKGTEISTLAIVMLDASLFPYRDVDISTTLILE